MKYYLSVLDFNTGKTHIYGLNVLQLPSDEMIERIITNKGHKVSDCEYMLATGIEVAINTD